MPAKINLTGQVKGKLTVIREAEPLILKSGKPRTRWLCLCECGNYIIVSTQSLMQGTTVSCGCYGQKARLEARRKKTESKLVGTKVGRWFIESYAGIKKQPGGQTRSLWNCCCDCGTKRQLTTNQLTEGSLSCGCLRSELLSTRETIDLTGRTINYLTVIERIGTKKYGKDKLSTPLWKCRCVCGNECLATTLSLLQGHKMSCGCKRRLDLTGQRFGSVVAEKYDISKKKWLCRCDCGNTCFATTGHLRSGYVTSCGCKFMSKNERIIYDHLKELNVNFKREYYFPKLKGPNGGVLRFDFAILNDIDVPIALIEYQGEQHFEEIENFGVDQREITDFIKRLFCDQSQILLYTINYDEDIIQKCDVILSKIFSVHVNDVPSL